MIKKLHFAYYVCTCLLLCASVSTRAQTVLTAGDIAVLGWNTDDAYPNERWAFMTMVGIQAGTLIHFTDAGYDQTISNFRAVSGNDGHMSWLVPSNIPRGTVIYATNNTINGSATGVSGQLGAGTAGFHPSGDQIIVYQGVQGVAATATFIYAINTGQLTAYSSGAGTWYTGTPLLAISDPLSYIPPTLTNGLTAVALTSNTTDPIGPGTLGTPNYGFDNFHYGGTTTGTKANLLAAIANPANWIADDVNPVALQAGGVFPTNLFSVLPVTLLDFQAEEETAGTVNLSWSTAMEANNDHFTLERSGDGLHYTLLGIVPGKGDSNLPVDYSYTDQSPGEGINYYRLTQTDRDGQSKILGTRKVEIKTIALRVGPNPAVHTLDVAFNRGAWREIKLYNSAEQLLQTIFPRVTTGNIKIGLQNYRPGIYYLAFTGNNGQNTVRRFVKRE